MFTRAKASKSRIVKSVVMVLALVAVLTFCLTACGNAVPTGAEYVAGTLAKSEYNQGESFVCDGAQIKITYDNGATETVNVTPAMVGNVQFNSVGATAVNVTYTVGGVSVAATIPVTVKDVLAADRVAAKAQVDTKYAAILSNTHDAGIDAILANAKAAIDAAATKDAIAAAVAMFETDAVALNDAKKAVAAQMDAVFAEAKIYVQYKTEAVAALEKAKADLKNVLSVNAAEDIGMAFNTTVAQILAKQGAYEDDDEGLIDRKIEILLLINDYKAQAEAVIALIMLNGNPATALDNCAPYATIIENLNWCYEYVTLAINLDGVKDGIEDYVENAMRTNVDEIYDLLANASVITVTPAPYVDGALGVDTIGDLLDAIAELRAELADQFGDIIADEWMANYLPAGAEDTIDLDTVIADITVLHGVLTLCQEAAADIIDDINNITLATDRATIEAIWADVKAWGEDAFFTLDDTVEIYDNLVYNLKVEDGVVTIDGAEVTYGTYDITKDTIITYYIYNLEDLADASIILDVLVIDELVAAIPEYIIYSNTSVDSEDAIIDAEEAIAAFKDTYSDEIYNEFCLVDGVDVFGEAVAAARAEYDALVAEAENVNELITKLPAVEDITKDYAGSALEAAYKAYCAFAANNADATTKYTDVITDEADLIDCIDQYIELAYVDQRDIIATVEIYAAVKAKIADIVDFSFREAIYVYAEDSIAIVNAIAYDDTGIDNFNRIDILSANLDKIADEAQEYADVITAAKTAADLK